MCCEPPDHHGHGHGHGHGHSHGHGDGHGHGRGHGRGWWQHGPPPPPYPPFPPFPPFRHVFGPMMKGIFRAFCGRGGPGRGIMAQFVREDGDNTIVELPLPGLTKDDVTVTTDGRTVRVALKETEETDNEAKDKEAKPLAARLRHLYGRLLPLEIALSWDVDPSSAQARIVNGILEVTLTRKEKPQDVDVQAG